MWPTYLQSFAGGLLIGLSAALFLLLEGRIAGISGIVGTALRGPGRDFPRNVAFIVGLMLGPLAYRAAFGEWPSIRVDATLGVMALAGLLVGFGSRIGSGCTSGHGVCGLARLSPRSIAAVGIFMSTAVATVAIMNILGVP
jgi:uncharacterized membrane protein YedE/YeeE